MDPNGAAALPIMRYGTILGTDFELMDFRHHDHATVFGAPCSDFSSALFVGDNAIASWRDSGTRRLRPIEDVEHGTR